MRRINRYIPIRIQNYFYEKKEAALNREDFLKWEASGCPVPPPHLAKQKIISRLAAEFDCRILVETGTYLGDTVYSQRNNFEMIYSVELSSRFYREARRRFKDYSSINILLGNSGDILPTLVLKIGKRALFWLDGHFSGGLTARGDKESPVFKELDAVFKNNLLRHVVLIDDARLFIGQRDYPTMEELDTYIKMQNQRYSMNIESDIIILTPDLC
ncbi:MAG: hypothetical protein Q8868_06160 [Bacteroidota bacterium]|nr:hypothetical protein [Bacteroidota bacterium]